MVGGCTSLGLGVECWVGGSTGLGLGVDGGWLYKSRSRC